MAEFSAFVRGGLKTVNVSSTRFGDAPDEAARPKVAKAGSRPRRGIARAATLDGF